jgi:hypothetical protein
MKAYITYTEYNNREYTLIGTSTNETVAKTLFTTVHMSEFQAANDDDRINLYLAEADISEEDFRILTDNIDEDEVSNILQKIDLGPDTRIIYTVNGGDF